jgi:post-segregation antitoxin (ccd killing protein)
MPVRATRAPIAIFEYGACMATRKVTITLDEDLADAMAETARVAGIPLSRLIASAAEREMRRGIARTALAEWQEAHGAFTPAELAAARAEMAAADLTYLRGSGETGAA